MHEFPYFAVCGGWRRRDDFDALEPTRWARLREAFELDDDLMPGETVLSDLGNGPQTTGSATRILARFVTLRFLVFATDAPRMTRSCRRNAPGPRRIRRRCVRHLPRRRRCVHLWRSPAMHRRAGSWFSWTMPPPPHARRSRSGAHSRCTALPTGSGWSTRGIRKRRPRQRRSPKLRSSVAPTTRAVSGGVGRACCAARQRCRDAGRASARTRADAWPRS
jgi:hypothetical protein